MASKLSSLPSNVYLPLILLSVVCWGFASPAAAQRGVAKEACVPSVPKLLTGQAIGFYSTVGRAIQEVGGRYSLQICAVETDQTLTTPDLLDHGEYEFGLVQSDVAHDAWFGHPNFNYEHAIGLISPLYVEAVHILVAPHLNIARVADLKGKKVWLGPKSSGTEYTARRVLKAAGLNPEADITPVPIPNGPQQLEQATKQLKEMNGLDAFFRVTVMPSTPLQSTLVSARRANEIRLFSLDYDLVTRLSADGSYIPTLIPSGYYHQGQSTLTVGVEALLLASKSAKNADVLALAQLLRYHRAEIESRIAELVHATGAGRAQPDTSLSLLSIPVSQALLSDIYSPDVGELLYNRWRDSIRPLLPQFVGFLLILLLLVLWQRRIIRDAFRAQPNIFMLAGVTLAVWCIASGILYYFESSVNEQFNSFPRALRFGFLYLVGVHGYSPLTPNGQVAVDITKWVSVALLGGFATPLVRQGWDSLTQKLRGSTGRRQKTRAKSWPMRESPLSNHDVLDMLQAGLASEIVVLKIETSECSFDSSVSALRGLKSSGVPDAVILSMLARADHQRAAVKMPA